MRLHTARPAVAWHVRTDRVSSFAENAGLVPSGAESEVRYPNPKLVISREGKTCTCRSLALSETNVALKVLTRRSCIWGQTATVKRPPFHLSIRLASVLSAFSNFADNT